MKPILIANTDPDEAGKIKMYLRKYFDVSVITEPDRLTKASFSAILIDHNFTSHSGIDFLMDVIGRYAVPVLMMTPPEDPQCANEALRAGAFNYIIKAGNYFQFLNIAVTDAINKFEERAELKKSIRELTSAIHDLEKKTGVKAVLKAAAPQTGVSRDSAAKDEDAAPEKKMAPPPKEINLLEEIVSRFKKGEVNLPTLPQIHLKFNQLVRKGADLSEVAAFLKQDVAISTKLINVSNAAFYRGLSKVSKLEDAISRLGLGTTRQYVEIISNRSLYTTSDKRFSGIMERLWEHSLACGFAAECTSTLLNVNSGADIFSLGLTHDVGKLVLLQVIGELGVKNDAIKEIDDAKIFKTLDLYHGRFGAVLLKRWAFSDLYSEVAMHHDQISQVEKPSHEFLCVHFANCLVNALGFGIRTVQTQDLSTIKSFELLRLRADEIRTIQDKTKEYLNGIKTVL